MSEEKLHSTDSIATGKLSNDCDLIDGSLFPRERLLGLSKWNDISNQLETRRLLARPLELDDYDRGYLEVLKQLTQVGDVSRAEFEKRFHEMRRINQIEEHYAIVVIEDLDTNMIVGASTLFLECKFIHNCAMRGRLEDVVVLNNYRGRNIGELVVSVIVELAREAYKCYKLTLDCTDELKKFYAKNGFVYGSNMLTIVF